MALTLRAWDVAMYPVFHFAPVNEDGSLVRTSLAQVLPHDGQIRLSWIARSTLSSKKLSEALSYQLSALSRDLAGS
jgi:hypothetical protein